jgi:catechol 2,3-dioxygenase-like lactoylglutathione lyase family enzyme
VLHHLLFWVPDLERAGESWTWLLGELGYTVDPAAEEYLLFRHPTGLRIVFESSPDMVEGMLYSRMRPGLNHLAFSVPSIGALKSIVGEAVQYGWSALPVDRHPIAPGDEVVYLEDRDGFEVELVATPQG